jgi:quinol monooxygenase YgiN
VARETIIRVDAPLMTLVNVFTVDPSKQQALVDILVEATKARMRDLPGFISANIHRSLDGAHVVNYAQWRTKEDFEAARQAPEAGKHMQKAASMAKFEPIVCEVSYVDHADST